MDKVSAAILQSKIEELEQMLAAKKRQLAQAQVPLFEQNAAPAAVREISPENLSNAAHTEINNHSPPEAKIALFRSLFKGREDVYAKRFESKKTGKSGYQPACRNEWV